MLRWTLALFLGLIIACSSGDGGEKARSILLSPTTGHSGGQTSENQNSGPPKPTPEIDTTREAGTAQPTPEIDATREAGTAQAGTGGQTPATGPRGTLTPEARSQPVAGGTPVATPTVIPAVATEAPSGPVVTLGGVPFRVELAITSQQRIQGLSGHPPLAPDEGMLFVFEQAQKFSFWMKEMLFPLDMIWIDAECTVAHITRDAPPPAPGQSLSDLPRYGPPVPVLYVLEINAGEAEAAAVTVGSPARFTGSLAGRFGC